MQNTNLPQKFDHNTGEAAISKLWEKHKAFHAEIDETKEPFCIMMPPPNVTGSLHLGHALTFTIQDIIVRYQRALGKDVLYQPGTDHAGIATQMLVERHLAKEGLTRHDLGREKFLERVWQWKKESGDTILNQLQRLGVSGHWERSRFTMDDGLSEAVKKVFIELYNKGLIYRDKRLVNWDCQLLTAVSDLEVEEKEQKGHMWYFKYALKNNPEEHIMVGTTRPETMFGDTAVAVNPEDERYKHLVGQEVIIPGNGKAIPVVADEHADPEKGTGAVKITPAHDFNDFEVGQRHNLDMINIMDEYGRMNDHAVVPEAYQGLDRFEARKKLVAAMEGSGALSHVENIVNMLPYGDRSGSVLEPRLTDQWFVDAKTLAQPAIKAVEKGDTNYVPDNWANVYFEWLRNIRPWCISRQIWWGHRVPAWYGPDEKVFVATTEKEAQAQAKAHYGKPVELRRDEDVLDTWFSSALWPFSTLDWPDQTPELKRYYPTSVLVTGFDIIFFWVARMMMMGMHFMEDVPFKDVYIHALVRDEKGQKMSKTKGNVIDPLEAIEKYGADALRFALALLAVAGRDIKFSMSKIEGARNFVTKLWNVARYTEMNGARLVPGFDPVQEAALTINKWIGSEINAACQKVSEALDNYSLGEAATTLYHLVKNVFCDWYIEFSKPVLANGTDAEKMETRATLAWGLKRILMALNPFMPYVTEELWSHLRPASATDNDMLCLKEWQGSSGYNQLAANEMNWVIELISEIRSVRSSLNVPPSTIVNLLFSQLNDEKQQWIDTNLQLVERLARVTVNLEKADGQDWIASVVKDAVFALDLKSVINVDEEKARLQKEIVKVDKDINLINSRLSKPDFVARAPEAVITENKERLAELREKRLLLEASLNRLR